MDGLWDFYFFLLCVLLHKQYRSLKEAAAMAIDIARQKIIALALVRDEIATDPVPAGENNVARVRKIMRVAGTSEDEARAFLKAQEEACARMRKTA